MQEEALQRWAEFNRRKWNCRVELKKFQAPESDAYCECLFFLDRRGRLFLPPFNYYHPVVFTPTPTNKNFKITRQWLKVAEEMIKGMGEAGCPVDFVFPPEFQDVRPWRWGNYKVSVKYTYRVTLPYEEAIADNAVRQRIKKSKAAGYETRQADSLSDVYECLVDTEKRKGFSHHLTLRDLELCREILGDEIFRPYVCYSKDGEPACGSIELVLSKDRALGLVLGTKQEHLANGATHNLREFMFRDLTERGVRSFDFCGANIPSVAEAKAQWGAELVPYYAVRERRFWDLIKEGGKWFKSMNGTN